MSIGTHIEAKLVAPDSGTYALCGTRVFWGEVPPSCELPFVSYTRVGGAPEQHLTGKTDKSFTRIRFSCVAKTLHEATAVSKAIQEIFNPSYSAELSETLVDGCEIVSDLDGYDAAAKRAQAVLDITFLHN